MFKDDFVSIARAHHLSLRTERSYWCAASRHIKWLGAKSRQELERDPTGQFRRHLTSLANANGNRVDGDEGVSASTQNLFFHALRFLYTKVIGVELGDLSDIPRATGHQRIVEVPDADLGKRLVESVPGQTGLALRLILGTGCRLNDVLRLRLKDLDFARGLIAIQQSKGDKARVVPMPKALVTELRTLVAQRETIHAQDLQDGFGWVHTPGCLAQKYPGIEKSLEWQYLFAADHRSKDPRTGNFGRTHILDITLQRAFARARIRCRVQKRYTIHSLRHCAAQFWERKGVPPSTIQSLLGHAKFETTSRYLLSGEKSVANVPTPI